MRRGQVGTASRFGRVKVAVVVCVASAQVKVATESVAKIGASATRVPRGFAMQTPARRGARMRERTAILKR